jgi:hypothetical protein
MPKAGRTAATNSEEIVCQISSGAERQSCLLLKITNKPQHLVVGKKLNHKILTLGQPWSTVYGERGQARFFGVKPKLAVANK